MARYRWPVLAVWALIIAVGAAIYPSLEARLGMPDYSVQGSESAQAQTLTAEQFPELGAEQDVIVFSSDRITTDDPNYAAVVDRILGIVREHPDVTALIGPYDPVAGDQVSADHHVAVAVIGLDGSEAQRARSAGEIQDQVRANSQTEEVQAYLTGSSPLNNDLSDVEAQDQSVAELIGIPVALLILLLAFGALVPAVLPIVVAMAGVLSCLAVLTLLADPLHLDRFVIVTTTMIGIGIGIDYALFVVSRFREELASAASRHRDPKTAVEHAVRVALDTSGRTIVASGLIVIVALGSMMVINGHIFLEIAVASTLVVTCCLVTGLTLLPAVLAVLGPKVNAGALPRALRPPTSEDGSAGSGRWARWARFVLRRPLLLGLPVLFLLAGAALPATSMKLGMDLGTAALSQTPSGTGQQIVAESFSPGSVAPITVTACSDDGPLSAADLAGIATVTESLNADQRVAQVVSVTTLLDRTVGGHTAENLQQGLTQPEVHAQLDRLVNTDQGGGCTHLNVVAAVPVDSPEASALVETIRGTIVPQAFAGTDVTAQVGGLTAQYVDLAAETTGKLPLVVLIVLALSFCYLLVVFRSLLLPAKAVLLNLLATSAALGVTVFVFQEGHLSELLGFTSVGTLQAFLPVTIFALLFGLSMDYEVFLVRRMQEEWQRSGDNDHAVAVGLDRTARQITAGAAIMAAVFGSFLVADVLELKQFGFSLAVAVIIDATLIRMVLVPAAMGFARRANWWLPPALARRLPTVRSEWSTMPKDMIVGASDVTVGRRSSATSPATPPPPMRRGGRHRAPSRPVDVHHQHPGAEADRPPTLDRRPPTLTLPAAIPRTKPRPRSEGAAPPHRAPSPAQHSRSRPEPDLVLADRYGARPPAAHRSGSTAK